MATLANGGTRVTPCTCSSRSMTDRAGRRFRRPRRSRKSPSIRKKLEPIRDGLWMVVTRASRDWHHGAGGRQGRRRQRPARRRLFPPQGRCPRGQRQDRAQSSADNGWFVFFAPARQPDRSQAWSSRWNTASTAAMPRADHAPYSRYVLRVAEEDRPLPKPPTSDDMKWDCERRRSS